MKHGANYVLLLPVT